MSENEVVGLVAQSVEQRTENPCVGGSIPPQATIKINELGSCPLLGVLSLIVM